MYRAASTSFHRERRRLIGERLLIWRPRFRRFTLDRTIETVPSSFLSLYHVHHESRPAQFRR